MINVCIIFGVIALITKWKFCKDLKIIYLYQYFKNVCVCVCVCVLNDMTGLKNVA